MVRVKYTAPGNTLNILWYSGCRCREQRQAPGACSGLQWFAVLCSGFDGTSASSAKHGSFKIQRLTRPACLENSWRLSRISRSPAQERAGDSRVSAAYGEQQFRCPSKLEIEARRVERRTERGF